MALRLGRGLWAGRGGAAHEGGVGLGAFLKGTLVEKPSRRASTASSLPMGQGWPVTCTHTQLHLLLTLHSGLEPRSAFLPPLSWPRGA